jgi:hypothetical protein
MWQFLKILFFGGSTVITPHAIDVAESWVEISPSEPLEAITSGAAIQIQLGNLVSAQPDVLSRMSAAERQYPDNCVRGRLLTTKGSEVEIANLSTAASSDATFLVLSREGGIPTGDKFSRVMLRAMCELRGVVVSWRNYSE